MSDSSWDSYSAEESTATAVEAVTGGLDVDALQSDITPIIDAAATDTWQGDNATSWADFNQATANEAALYAADEVQYAADLYAGGYEEAGDAAIARAQYSTDVAADHSATADGYSAVAESEYGLAAAGYGTAADAIADASSYETTSYAAADTGFETSSYDTAVADTSYETPSYDTPAADATE